MGDLISRDALRKAFQYRIKFFNKSDFDKAMLIIDSVPAAEERAKGTKLLYMPRLKGHWIRPSNTSKRSYRRMCDQCHGISYFCGPINYPNCPYCLADMRGDDNDK